jgi:hypothetical protein
MKKFKQYTDDDRRSCKREASTRGNVRASSTAEDKFTLEVTSPLTATWLRGGEVGTCSEGRHIAIAVAPPAQSAQAVGD